MATGAAGPAWTTFKIFSSSLLSALDFTSSTCFFVNLSSFCSFLIRTVDSTAQVLLQLLDRILDLGRLSPLGIVNERLHVLQKVSVRVRGHRGRGAGGPPRLVLFPLGEWAVIFGFLRE